MALELVGAVGVKVRPDAKGFRRETKREILDQLRGLEEEIKVQVEPDVRVDHRRAQRAMENAFSGMRGTKQKVPVDIEIDENIDTSSFKKRLKEELEEASTVRIKAETGEAESDLADLERKMDDLADEAERLPEALEEARKQSKAMLDGNASSLRTLQDAASNLNDELNGLSKLEGQQRDARKAANIEQRIADKAHRDSMREVAALEKKVADLGKKYRETRGKENRALVKAERDALKERLDGLKAERNDLRSLASERKKEAQLADRELTKTQNQMSKIKNKIKDNEQAQRDLNAAQQDFIKDSEQKISQLEDEMKMNKNNTAELEKQLEVQRAVLEARKKSNEELLDSAKDLDLTLSHWNDFKKGIKDGTNDNVRYFGLMALKHKDMTKSQMEDLRELERREREVFAVRQKHYKEFGQFEEIFNRKAIMPEMQKIMDKQKLKVQAEIDRAALQLSLQSMKPMRIPVTMFLADQARWGADVSRAISGWQVMTDIQQAFKETTANLDRLSIAAGKMAVVGTSLFAVLGAGAGVVGALGNDLGRLARGALVIPGVLMALGAAGYTVSRAFSGFGKAVGGNEEAMAALLPAARKAARALQELGATLDDEVGAAVWENIGDSMHDMIRELEGPLVDGLVGTAEEMGHALKGVFQSIDQFSSDGKLTKMFDLINKGFENSRAAAGNFVTGLLELSHAGAKVFPELGKWVDGVAESFAKWADVNNQNGNIEKWLREAGQEAKHLGTILTQTVGIMGALGDAAERAGYGGLQPMAEGLTKINEAARGEFFQSNMTTIFEGAGEAASRMGRGFKNLGTAILSQSPLISRAMQASGTIVENVLNGMAEGFTNTRLTQGVDTFFNGMVKSSSKLGDLMPKVAQSVGDFLPLAANLVDGAINIADAFMDLWNRSDKLIGALTRVTPVLSDIVVGFIELAHGPLVFLADGLASVIDFFTQLPGPIQKAAGVAALAAVGFAALAKSFVGLTMGAMRVAPAVTQMGHAAQTLARTRSPLQSFNVLLGNMEPAAKRAATGMDTAAKASGNLLRDASATERTFYTFGRNADDAGNKAQSFGNKVNDAGGKAGGLRGKLSGATAFLGGPWGIAFMAAGAVVTAFVGKLAHDAAEMKGHVDSLKPTIGSLGQFTSETSRVVAEALNDMETSFAATDVFREEAETVGEALQRIGLSSREVADQLRTDRPAYDELAQGLRDLEGMGRNTAEGAEYYRQKEMALAQQLGVTWEQLNDNRSQLADTGEAMQQQAEAADRAARSQAALGGKFQSSVGQTQAYSNALEVLGDSGLSASEKVQALSSAIDQYNDGAMASADAAYKFQSGLDQAEATAQRFIDSQVGLGDVLKDNGTNIDMAAQGGKELYEVLRTSSGTALEYAIALRDTGASASEVKDALAKGRSEFVANADAMGLNADAAGKLYDAMVEIPTEVESHIALEGADQAFAKAKELSETLGIEFDGKEFMAMLDADPELAKLAATDAQAVAEAWANETYLAGLDLDAGDVVKVVEEAKKKGLEWDSEKFMAMLNADPSLAEKAKNDIEGLLKAYEDYDYTTELKAETDEAQAKLDLIEEKLRMAETETNVKVALYADDTNFQAVMDRAKQLGMEIKDPDAFKAHVDANIDMFMEKNMTLDEIIKHFNDANPTATFDADTASAKQKVDEMEIATAGWDGSINTAFFEADGQGARAVMEEAGNIAKNWDNAQYMSTILADDTSVGEKFSAAKNLGLGWAAEKFQAIFGGDTAQVGDAVSTSVNTGAAWAMEKFMADFGGDTTPVDSAVAEGGEKGQLWDGSKFVDAQLGARSERVDFAVDNAIRAAERWDGMIVDAQFGARSERVAGAVSNAIAAAAPWDGKIIDAQLGARSERVAFAVGNAMAAVAPWNGRVIDAQLGARSERVSFAVSNANAIVQGQWVGRPFDAQLGARSERVHFAVSNAVAAASSWVGRVFDAQLGARSERVAFAVSNANAIAAGWQGKVFDAQFGARTERVGMALGNARAIGGQWQASSFDAQFGARSERVQLAMRNAQAIGNAWRASEFDAQFGGRTERVNQAKHNADVQGWHWMGSNFDAQFGARIGGVYSAYSSAMAVGNSWASRTFTATLTARKRMADGGLAFADGGIVDKVLKHTVKRFANGGVDRETSTMLRALSRSTPENHRAQIATPVTPFRVWAEPETGGEAYIPLASSKRARSTQIWEETGDLLGVNWEAYAQGGIRGRSSDPTRSNQGAISSQRPLEVNVNNYHPQAEPSSVTTNKALQFAAALL